MLSGCLFFSFVLRFLVISRLLHIHFLSYLFCCIMLLVIYRKPLVRRISEASAEILFFPSNGSSTHYRIEYKRGRDYDHVGFENGILLQDDGRASFLKYMVLQTRLVRNTEYVFRVVPLVYISRNYYPGIPSPAATASARVQGELLYIVLVLFHVWYENHHRFAQKNTVYHLLPVE